MHLSVVLSVLAPALALANTVDFHEKIDFLPRGWEFNREASHDEPLVLHVALQNQNVEAFEQQVYDISTPGSKLYGKFLDAEDVESFMAPLKESHDSVMQWLKNCNVSKVVPDGDWISISTTAGNAGEFLKSKFAWFHQKETGREELRTMQYSIPSDLVEHVDFVHPTIKFPSTQELLSGVRKVSTSELKDAALLPGSTTPQKILKLYDVHYGASARDGNSVSYASFLNNSARYSDLRLFANKVAPFIKGRNFTVVPFAPAKNDQTSADSATEANLDNQYMISVSNPIPVTEFITAGCGPIKPDLLEPRGSCSNEPYLRFLQHASKRSDLPNVISFSYGEDEQAWPEKMAKKVCRGFAQLGARGVSIIFASGDFGPGSVCANNNGSKRQFTPAFPASCPFVTVVGATQNSGPEEATAFSGGGFSEYFKQPSYQKKAVSAYLKRNGGKQSKFFTEGGRGYPDVAAQGLNFEIADNGNIVLVKGTSASTPVFSSIIALLNSARISSGKKPLGFLNPFLYSKGQSGLTDIKKGSSRGCVTGPTKDLIPLAGFKAITGWDPVTGLGTPNFGKLLNAAAPGVKNKGGFV